MYTVNVCGPNVYGHTWLSQCDPQENDYFKYYIIFKQKETVSLRSLWRHFSLSGAPESLDVKAQIEGIEWILTRFKNKPNEK